MQSNLPRSQLLLGGFNFVKLLVEIAATASHYSDIGVAVIHCDGHVIIQ
jgi:hypothetical protein